MASQEKIDETIAKMYDDLTIAYHDLNFTHHDFHDCLIKLLECVELIPNLLGIDKKKIVIGVLVLIVNKLTIAEDEKTKILDILNSNLISAIIDLLMKVKESNNKNDKK